MPLIWLGFVSAIIFVAVLLGWLIQPLLGQTLFTAAFVFSLWSLKLSFLPEFVALSQLSQIFVLGFLASIALMAVRRLSGAGAMAALYTGLVVTLALVAPPLMLSAVGGGSTDAVSAEKIASGEPENQKLVADLRVFTDINLVEKPNIYVLLYDSLIPPEVAALFFGEGSAAYENVMEQHFLRPTGITAQNDIPPTRSTKHSIRSVMWLDTIGAEDHDYFTGVQDSPLSSLFRANGYEVYTGYVSTFWGEEVGSHISDYLHLASAPPALEETTLCIDAGDDIIGALRGFGICKVLGSFSAMPSFATAFTQMRRETGSDKKRRGEDWHRVVENHIRMSAYSAVPRFSFLYTFTPIGHAKTAYDHSLPADREQYRKHFKTRSPLAKLVIEDIVRVVNEVEPNAVVLVAGDHGTLISKRRDPEDSFALVDRHLIEMGLMRTDNRCVKQHQAEGFIANKGGYHTISSALLSIVACLANDSSIPTRLPTTYRSEFTGASGIEAFIQRHIGEELRATFAE